MGTWPAMRGPGASFQINPRLKQKTEMLRRILTVLTLMAVTPAMAQLEALQRCAQEADPVARLACYDKLLPPATRAAAAAGSVVAVGTPASPVLAARPTPSAAGNGGVPVLAQPARADTFGLPQPLKAQSPSIESAVSADFDGWNPNDKIRLANGQVWQVVDGSSASVAPRVRKVTVRAGPLGGFLLDLEGLNKTPRVRRVE